MSEWMRTKACPPQGRLHVSSPCLVALTCGSLSRPREPGLSFSQVWTFGGILSETRIWVALFLTSRGSPRTWHGRGAQGHEMIYYLLYGSIFLFLFFCPDCCRVG